MRCSATYLTAPVDASSLTVTVSSGADVSSGIIEVDNELMLVSSVDQSSGTATILPKGRGYRSTGAVPHDINATVTIAPTVPRSAVIRAINNEINGFFPRLFGVNMSTFTPNGVTNAYAIPTEAAIVLDVRYWDQYQWERVRHWEVENQADLTRYPSGRVIRVLSPTNWPVQVIYGTHPKVLTTDTQPFSDTGLPLSCKDVVILGALVRLLPVFDMARLAIVSVAAQELDQTRQVGGASIVTREIKAQYTARMMSEQLGLVNQFPARVHVTR
jgi:hypothetical protein